MDYDENNGNCFSNDDFLKTTFLLLVENSIETLSIFTPEVVQNKDNLISKIFAQKVLAVTKMLFLKNWVLGKHFRH